MTPGICRPLQAEGRATGSGISDTGTTTNPEPAPERMRRGSRCSRGNDSLSHTANYSSSWWQGSGSVACLPPRARVSCYRRRREHLWARVTTPAVFQEHARPRVHPFSFSALSPIRKRDLINELPRANAAALQRGCYTRAPRISSGASHSQSRGERLCRLSFIPSRSAWPPAWRLLYARSVRRIWHLRVLWVSASWHVLTNACAAFVRCLIPQQRLGFAAAVAEPSGESLSYHLDMFAFCPSCWARRL